MRAPTMLVVFGALVPLLGCRDVLDVHNGVPKASNENSIHTHDAGRSDPESHSDAASGRDAADLDQLGDALTPTTLTPDSGAVGEQHDGSIGIDSGMRDEAPPRVCRNGFADCADSGTDCMTDLSRSENCGGCGVSCAGNTACSPVGDASEFSCVSTCRSPYPDLCNGSCVDEQTDSQNCGGCGADFACSVGKECTAGRCQCPKDTIECESGCEAFTTANLCGADCNAECPIPAGEGHSICTDTGCDFECDGEYQKCNGECVTFTTTDNCGGCGNRCGLAHAAGASCKANACAYTACSPGWGDCSANAANTDGCETDLATTLDCGACRRGCSKNHASATTCNAGICAPTCASGFVDCARPSQPMPDDGCECRGTGCCANSGCQTQHDDGQTRVFFDCISGFTGDTNTDEDLAIDACANAEGTKANCWSCFGSAQYVVCGKNTLTCWGSHGAFTANLYSTARWPPACSTSNLPIMGGVNWH